MRSILLPLPTVTILRFALCALLLGGGAPPVAQAQPGPSDEAGALTSVPLLGGYGTVAPARIGRDVPAAQVLPLLIRSLHAVPPGATDDVDRRRDAVLTTLATLSAVHEAFASRAAGIALEQATDRRTRTELRDVLRLLGLELVEQRNTFIVRLDGGGDAERLRGRLSAGGVEPLDVLNRLNAGERVRVTVPSIAVPMPWPQATWERLLERRGLTESQWVSAVVGDRRASLVAYGLLGMDEETRRWFATTPDVLRAAWENPSSLVAAGRSLVIRGGMLQLPGGAEATSAWERLVGGRASRTPQFVRQILSRDSSRLAIFYDMVAQSGPAHQRFVLATSRRVREPLRALYAATPPTEEACDPAGRPFARCRFDAAVMLRAMTVRPSGELAGPVWRSMWSAVIAGAPPSARTATAKWLQRDGAIDAVWLVTQLAPLPPVERDLPLQRLAFAQRAFPSPADSDAADIAFVLAHFPTYPMLPLTLERMGVRGAATFANAIRAAQAIDAVDSERRAVVFAQFQGALVLLERLGRQGALPLGDAEKAASELFGLKLDGDRLYEGRIAGWLSQHVAPAWRRGRSELTPAEEDEAILAALAGRHQPAPPVAFTWEDERYVTAVAEREEARLRSGLPAMGTRTLGPVLAMSATVERVLAAPTVEALHAAASDAGRAVDGAAVTSPWLSEGDARNLRRDAQEAVRDLLEIKRPNDITRIAGRARPLQRLVEHMTASAMLATVYLVTSGEDDLRSLVDLMVRHDFGERSRRTDDDRRGRPWRLADTAGGDAGAQMLGSLLGLDVARASSYVRRMGAEMPSRPPTLDAAVRRVLQQTLALSDPHRLTDADRDAIADALRRGRERIAAAAPRASSSLLDTLPAGPRSAVLAWVAASDAPAMPTQFTRQEILRLGDADLAMRLHAWGSSQQPVTGCLCLQMHPPTAWETLAGRAASAEPAAHLVDLTLRLAEEFAAARVPAALLPAVLALATEDVIERAQVLDEDDMMAVVRTIDAIDRDRVEDYVAAVVGRGFGRPADGGSR